MEDLDLMMKIIVVGDGKVTHYLYSFNLKITIIDRKDYFNNKVCEKCFSWWIQENFRSRFFVKEAFCKTSWRRNWLLFMGHSWLGGV